MVDTDISGSHRNILPVQMSTGLDTIRLLRIILIKKNYVFMIHANLARLWQIVSGSRVVTCRGVEKMG